LTAWCTRPGEERICLKSLSRTKGNISIDNVKYERAFTDLPELVYPAVSNCRSSAKYEIVYHGS